MTTGSTDRTTFRVRGQRWRLPLLGVALAALAYASGSLAGGAAIMAFWALLAATLWRLRVVADHRGARIVNLWRSHTVEWPQVARVTHDEDAPGALCRFTMRSGEVIRAWGLYDASPGANARAIDASIARLDRMRRADHPSASSPLAVAPRPAPARLWDPAMAATVIGLLVAGVGALVLGSRLLFSALDLAHHGVSVEAVVTDVVSGRDPSVELRFEVDGQPVVHRTEDWQEPLPTVGATVRAVYPKDDPARISDPRLVGATSDGEAGFTLVLGIGALVAAPVLWVRHRPAARR